MRVPDEVYLVIAPHGGRDDFAALFHEAGHTEHYAHVDRELPVEERYFGDNSITEGFAFLLEHLVSEPGVAAPQAGRRGPRADRCATRARPSSSSCAATRPSCATSSSCTTRAPTSTRCRRATRSCSGGALRVDWPQATWLSDVDPFFYAARYLRAWALETQLRAPARGALRRGLVRAARARASTCAALWRRGQSAPPEELLGEPLDFSVLLADARGRSRPSFPSIALSTPLRLACRRS